MSQTISREKLQTLIATGTPPAIVEALPRQYYDAEHLPGAINIPHDVVPTIASDLIPDKDQPVIVYCANAQCRNSHIAAEAFRDLGYRHVFEYTAGKQDWKEAGLPLEIGEGVK